MNQGRMVEALESFRQARLRDPSLFTARLNEGIALLNIQRLEEARDVLLEAAEREPENARAWYNLGILYRNLGQADSAIQAFQRVAQIDSGDADALYFLGQLHTQVMRYDQAIAWYERCLALDSLHVSAEFGLARAYQLSGNEEAARRHLERFDQLTQSNLGKPISFTYGEQGPYSMAEPVAGADVPPASSAVRFSPIPAQAGIRFEPGERQTQPDRILPLLGSGACFIDFDADRQPDLLLLGGARGPALYRNRGGRFTDVTQRAGLGGGADTLGCAVGDYDNDGADDLAIGSATGVALYRNQGAGAFRDVTLSSGIRVDGLPLGLTFVDYDHDGDLDLYVSRFSNFALGAGGAFNFPLAQAPASNVLWRNNGNRTFTDWTEQAGLKFDAPGIGALPTDFNNDRAIDFILTGWRGGAGVFLNNREGPFRPADAWKSDFTGPAAGAVAFDFNKDSWMDLAFTHWGAASSGPGLSVWRNLAGSGFQQMDLPEFAPHLGWGLTALDFDNDGWLDLAAVGEEGDRGHVRLLRNVGNDRFADVTEMTGLGALSLDRPRALLAGDIDGDGDSDLVLTQNRRPPMLLRNDGGNRRASVRLALQGLSDNRSGIGTKVEIFAGALRQKWEVASSSGYLGQNPREIVAGLYDAEEADIVRLLWPGGVPQDEIQLAARARHVVRQIDRRGSSCPVVFVWNGERYEFISDMIGPGILGEWVAPGERNISDPNEYLKVEGSVVKPKNGRLSFRFAEVMEEITYLDHVRLLAVDHPSDTAVYPNEYFASQPPFPEFQVISSRDGRPPFHARDDRGRNVLPELLQRDRRYVSDFDALPFTGFTKLHYLELDLGEIREGEPLRLLMHGFTDYFTATSVFAAYQAGVQAVVPFLEILGRDGEWKRAVDDIGFPAGLARTMVADLSGRLPPGARRVRIGTNLKIYWDQILVDRTPQNSSIELREVPLVEASLAFRGYPRRVEGRIRGDVTYDYNTVSATGPFARHSGQYTAYGDVLSLLTTADDRFAIIGSGDEASLEFDPSSLPALRPGWSRDYFLYADGFAKEMDFHAALPGTVEPLPFHSMGQYPYGPDKKYPIDSLHLHYRLGWNTRSISGQDVRSYRFGYPSH